MKKSITGSNANHAGIKLLIFIVSILLQINYSYSACLLKQSSLSARQAGGQAEVRVPGINFQLKNAESEFIIEVMIRKGTIKGMARFEQKLPPGYFAIPVETQGGKFTFKNQKIKIVWMRMPEQNSFKISYRIKVYKDFSEVLFIGCKFQCVINKKKKNFTANKRISSIPQSAVALNINTRGGSGSGSGSGKGSKSGGGKLIEMKVQNVKGMFGKECYPDRGKSKHNKM